MGKKRNALGKGLGAFFNSGKEDNSSTKKRSKSSKSNKTKKTENEAVEGVQKVESEPELNKIEVTETYTEEIQEAVSEPKVEIKLTINEEEKLEPVAEELDSITETQEPATETQEHETETLDPVTETQEPATETQEHEKLNLEIISEKQEPTLEKLEPINKNEEEKSEPVTPLVLPMEKAVRSEGENKETLVNTPNHPALTAQDMEVPHIPNFIPITSSKQLGNIIKIRLDEIRANPYQPRQHFDEEKLAELAESIKIHGVVQPVVVMRSPEGYRLIVGERRTRAAKLAGLDSIPAIVRDVADQQILEVALIENLQRQDLNPIEEAQAFSYLLKNHGLSHEELATRIGCSRPAVSNTLRLLALSDSMRADIISGEVKAGHARAVLAIEDEHERAKIWEIIKSKSLSVRQTENLVKDFLKKKEATSQEETATSKHFKPSPEWASLMEGLRTSLHTDVRLCAKNAEKGKVEFHYSSAEELMHLMDLFVNLTEASGTAPISAPGDETALAPGYPALSHDPVSNKRDFFD